MKSNNEIMRTTKIRQLAVQLLSYIDETEVTWDSGLLADAAEHAQEIIDLTLALEEIGEGEEFEEGEE